MPDTSKGSRAGCNVRQVGWGLGSLRGAAWVMVPVLTQVSRVGKGLYM